jgi:Uncharacterized conserved protein
MSDIKFSRDELDRIVHKIKKYFNDELDQDIGAFEAEFLIDFSLKKWGCFSIIEGYSTHICCLRKKQTN